MPLAMKRTSLDQWIKDKHGIAADDRQAMESYQLSRIRALFEYAKVHSPFYRRLYEEYGAPESLEAFCLFPTIDAHDLVLHGPSMLCVKQSEISRIVTFQFPQQGEPVGLTTLQTSGTVESPKRIYFTREDIELTLDFFVHGMKTMCGPSDRALILFPAKTPDSVGALLSEALIRLGLTVHCEDDEKAAALLRDKSVDVVCGPRSSLLAVSKQTKGINVRAVLSSSESLSADDRNMLERAWQCDIFDHYGMTETGLGGAVECEAHQGMHIRENDLYVEVVDADGHKVADGDIGELAVTTLTRRGMPFIRYRTGDEAILTGERCPCGSLLRRILYIKRKDRGV